jgi:hypothetical protein
MTIWLKQSSAVTVKVGPFVDSTDGATAETGLTISQGDIRLAKNGGDFAQTNNAAGATHDEGGYYDVPLDTTDTNTLGSLRLAVGESGALPVWADFMVVPANVWDSLFGADKLQVDAVEISGDSGAADNLEAATDGGSYNVGGGAVVAASVTGAVGSVTGNVGGNVAGSVGSVGANGITAASLHSDVTTELQTGLATAASLTAIADNVAAILADTGTDGVPLTAAAVDAILDEAVEGAVTFRQLLRLFAAAIVGKATGGETTTVTYRDLADSKDRLTFTVDEDGNRSAVVRDAT